jgi:hypothetical protein
MAGEGRTRLQGAPSRATPTRGNQVGDEGTLRGPLVLSTRTQRTRRGGPYGITEEIRRENERRRRAFDEEAANLFPQSRQNETVKRIVENRKRFERMAEACFPTAKPQERWTFQAASESWGSRGTRGQGGRELPQEVHPQTGPRLRVSE